MLDKYIEVAGEGKYYKVAKEFNLELEIYSNSSKVTRVERHVSKKAIDEIVETVVANGFPRSDIAFGGMNDQITWWRKNDVQRNATKLLFTSQDQDLLFMIPIWVDNLSFQKLKYRYSNFHPVFEPETPDAEEKAFSEAVTHAQTIAKSIALAGGVRLGKLMQVQEFGFSKKGSGYQGDYDWDNYMYALPVAGSNARHVGNTQDISLNEIGIPRQTLTVKVRARFQLGD